MDEVFVVNLELKGGDIVETFRRLKELQKKDSVFNDSTTISFFHVKLTAGFYETFEEFADLVQAVISKNKEGIINHVKKVFPKYADNEELNPALFNIIISSQKLGMSFTDEEEDIMYNCCQKPNTK